MSDTVKKNLGIVTAYGYARSKGYEGTEEEFAELMASYAEVAEDAAQSASEAAQSATNAAGSATAASGSASSAATSASSASGSAQSAEAAQAAAQQSATAAAGSATSASGSATAASGSAAQAAQSATSAAGSATSAQSYSGTAASAAQAASGSADDADTSATAAAASAAAAAESARTLTIDDTLTQQGQAADSKKTGDEISAIKADLSDVNERLDSEIADVKSAINEAVSYNETWTNITLTVQTDGRYDTSGAFHADTGRRYAIVSPVVPGKHYRLSTIISSTLIPAILYFNGDSFLSYEKTGNGTQETVTNYEFTIPENCNKLIVQNATSATGEFKLEKLSESEYVFKAYTKPESDDRYAEKTSVYTKAQADDQFYSQTDAEDLENAVNGIENDIYTPTTSWKNITLTVQTDGYYGTNGTFNPGSWRRYAIVTPVIPGEKYRLSTVLSSALIPAVVFFNNTTFESYLKTGTGTQETVTNYEFTIPDNVNKVIVQNSTSSAGEFKLEKQVTSLELNVYTKPEVDLRIENSLKRYGVKWSVSNDDDLGERCFYAYGLTATIGVGSTSGSSDFDNIYPWSDIKRCNINRNANGAEIVTFEGETGFALDGTNGDVFVYIPKFSYERYEEDGYEYHVISKPNGMIPLHPAFVDGDKLLDGIYIGAFEGSVDSDRLQSISDVIPANNIVPASFLSYAQANGSNYSLYGIKEVSAIWALMAVEYGCRNSNRVIGYGASDFEQPSEAMERDRIVLAGTGVNTVRTIKWSASHKGYMPVGSNVTVCDTTQANILTQAKLISSVDSGDYTDWTFNGDPIDVTTNCFIGSAPLNTDFVENAPSGGLTWHTGRADWISGSNVRNPNRYRWIENVCGNVWHFLPDITFHNCQMYLCNTMAKYGFGKVSDGYVAKSAVFPEQTNNGSKADSVDVNYWVDGLNIDPLANKTIIGRHWNKSLVSTKAFGAYYYMKTGTNVVCNGGGFDHLYRSNVLTNRAWDGTSIKWHLYGARLIFKPIM